MYVILQKLIIRGGWLVMKKILVFSFVLLLAWSCAAMAQVPAKITINVASVYPVDSPIDKGLVKFKELVAERSDGRIEVLVQPASAMGDERQIFEMLSQGSVEYGALGTNDISTYYPKYFICEVPYMFSSQEDFWKFWQGPGKELSAIIEKERGVRTEGVVFRGARYLTANRPIKSVADLKGLKLRLPPVSAWFKVWEALGAVPSNIAFNEVYMALATGVVEAQENPLETILSYKFHEVQKYLMPTEHVYTAGRILSSVQWWNKLNKDDQVLLTEAMEESIAYANSLTKDADATLLKELQELGMVLIEVDKAEFKEAVQPVLDELAKEWDSAFYAKVKEALQ